MHSYTDVTDSTFLVSYETDTDGNRLRLRRESFDLRNGLLLHQYRVSGDYQSITISVQYNGKHVADSPYKVGPVLHENCACPLRSHEEWMRDFECREADSQILDDLKPFREDGINVTNLYERGAEMFPRVSFIHYSIVDSKVSVHVCVCYELIFPVIVYHVEFCKIPSLVWLLCSVNRFSCG